MVPWRLEYQSNIRSMTSSGLECAGLKKHMFFCLLAAGRGPGLLAAIFLSSENFESLSFYVSVDYKKRLVILPLPFFQVMPSYLIDLPSADHAIWADNIKLHKNAPTPLTIFRDQRAYLYLCDCLRRMWATSEFTNFEASDDFNVDESSETSSDALETRRMGSKLDRGKMSF